MFTEVCLAVIYCVGVSVALPTTTTEKPARTCICFLLLEPVCGVDGKIYYNKCALDCAGVQEADAGECGSLCACPKIYEPVCGLDGKTYPNGCEMMCAGVAQFQEGACTVTSPLTDNVSTQIPCACPAMFRLVCGVDGITYHNDCTMNCAGVGLAHDGPCEENTTPPPTQYPCICPLILRPVCGVDGITYPNDCTMNCAGVGLAHDGPCEQNTTLPPLTNPIAK